jgi:hypothetical protein
MEENMLKKEFKQSDVQRARNLITKKFGDKTKLQSGYTKAHVARKEGDIWEENGKQWTIKDGVRQNITRLDGAKKAVRIPFKCPKCNGSMKHHLAQKMYKIHGFCFDCTIDYEAELRDKGLYDDYEKAMMHGNMESFITHLESYVADELLSEKTFVTEDGVVEDWNYNKEKFKEQMQEGLTEYVKLLRQHMYKE